MLKIYLAGPDVFLADALDVGRRKKEFCRKAGFSGLFPLDQDPSVGADAAAIFRANRALMDEADIGLFNLTPFRGPGADAGTVFELGYMFCQGKEVHGYSSSESEYAERARATSGPVVERDGHLRDRDGLGIEDFGLSDNLMILRAIEEAGGHFVAAQAPGDLAAFVAFGRVLDRLAGGLPPT